MNRFFYSIIITVLFPFYFVQFIWKAFRDNQLDSIKIGERLGFIPYSKIKRNNIWIHSVSLGETIVSADIVKFLLITYPNCNVIITTTTETGYKQVKKIHKKYLNKRVFHCFFPFDLFFLQKIFIERVRPKLLLLIETELWPNMLHISKKKQIPVILVNARMSEKTFKGYSKFPKLTRGILSNITKIICQNKQDYYHFLGLGCSKKNMQISGSLKYEIYENPSETEYGVTLKKNWEKSCQKNIKVFLMASTHEDEEIQILRYYKEIKKNHPSLLFMIAPRHPRRFESVYELAKNYTKNVIKYSEQKLPRSADDIIILDSIGEMMIFYAACDIVFMGGTFVNKGGHNMLEPSLLGKPTVCGPCLFNFQAISDDLVANKGMIKLNDVGGLVQVCHQLLNNKNYYEEISENAIKVVQSNRGALEKTCQTIDNVLSVL